MKSNKKLSEKEILNFLKKNPTFIHKILTEDELLKMGNQSFIEATKGDPFSRFDKKDLEDKIWREIADRRRQFLKVLGFGSLVGASALFGREFGIREALAQTPSIIVKPESFVETASYIIFKDGTEIKAKNGDTGQIESNETNSATIQQAINTLGSDGGIITFKRGKYVLEDFIVPAPWPDDLTGTLILEGEGIYNTILQTAVELSHTYQGLIGYGREGINPSINTVVIRDLTLDDNYPANPQDPNASLFHVYCTSWIERVRFLNPQGFAVFCGGDTNHTIINCIFENCGQPPEEGHTDIIGGGAASTKAIGNLYLNSMGNFIDHENPKYAIFAFNRCINHDIGGVYILGHKCCVIGNILILNTPDVGGIAADTYTTDRVGPNVVVGNIHNFASVSKATDEDIIIDPYTGQYYFNYAALDEDFFFFGPYHTLQSKGGGATLSIRPNKHLEIYNNSAGKLLAFFHGDYGDLIVNDGSIEVKQKGVNVSVPAGSSSLNVSLPKTERNDQYGILVVPQWDTTVWILNKSTTGFTVNFGTAPASDSYLDWFLYR